MPSGPSAPVRVGIPVIPGNPGRSRIKILARPRARSERPITPSPKRSNISRPAVLPKEPPRGAPIPPRLDQEIEDVAVFVHRPPEILQPAVERDDELVEMPRVTLLPAAAAEGGRPGRITSTWETSRRHRRCAQLRRGRLHAPGAVVLRGGEACPEVRCEPHRPRGAALHRGPDEGVEYRQPWALGHSGPACQAPPPWH